jgi:hypothetical protein
MGMQVRSVSVALLLVAACGGGKGTNMDVGGSGGAGGAAGGGGGVSPECSKVACLQQVEELLVGCSGDGACVYHSDVPGVPGTTTQCYDNGVKVLETFDTPRSSTSFTLSGTFKVEKDGSLCYTRSSVAVTMDLDAGAGAKFTSDSTTRDGSGKTILTAHVDIDGVATVTCPGGSPSLVPASCGFPAFVINGGPTVKSTAASVCDNGTCAF